MLNDDLSLDYDIGGLAVSATFLIALLLFGALITQVLLRYSLQCSLLKQLIVKRGGVQSIFGSLLSTCILSLVDDFYFHHVPVLVPLFVIHFCFFTAGARGSAGNVGASRQLLGLCLSLHHLLSHQIVHSGHEYLRGTGMLLCVACEYFN